MDPSRSRPTPDDPDQMIRELRSLVDWPFLRELEAPPGAGNVADLDQDVLQPLTNADIHRPEAMAPPSFTLRPQGLDDLSSSIEGRPSNQRGLEQAIQPFLNFSAPQTTSASTSEPLPSSLAPDKDRSSEHAPNVFNHEFDKSLIQQIVQSYQHSDLPSFQMHSSSHTECLDGSPEASTSSGYAPRSPWPFEDSRQCLPSPASASSPYTASSMTSNITIDTQRHLHLPASPLRYPHVSLTNFDGQTSQPETNSSNQVLLPSRSTTSHLSLSSFLPIPPVNNTRRESHDHRPLPGVSSSSSQMYSPTGDQSSSPTRTPYSTPHPSNYTSSPYRTIVPSTRQRHRPRPSHLPSSSAYASSSTFARTPEQTYMATSEKGPSSHPQDPQVVHIEPFEGSLPRRPERANFERILGRFSPSQSQPLGQVHGKPRSQRPDTASSSSMVPPARKIERRGAISGPITPPTSRTNETREPSESSYHRRAPDKKRTRPPSEDHGKDSKRQKTIVQPKEAEKKKRNVACLSCRKKKKRCDKRPGSIRCVCCENEGDGKICQYDLCSYA